MGGQACEERQHRNQQVAGHGLHVDEREEMNVEDGAHLVNEKPNGRRRALKWEGEKGVHFIISVKI